MALYYQAESIDGPVVVKPKDGKRFTLEELQDLVGGFIELAPSLPWLPKELDGKYIVCDEDGVLKGRQINYDISLLYGSELVGDILVCEPDEIE